MGNNAAFTAFESIVMHLAAQGKLTLAVLDTAAEAYRGTDIDSGGCQGRTTAAGQDIAEVCVRLVRPDFAPSAVLPPEDEDGWGWWDEFGNIRRDRWGWR